MNRTATTDEDASSDGFLTLREEVQAGVIEAAHRFIEAVRTNNNEGGTSFGRIILPPRVGKTVIAAKLVRRQQRTAVFLAPRKFLVDQAAAEFRTHLPEAPVWKLYGGCTEVRSEGVIVATYETMLNLLKKDEIPSIVREASIIFADEAHHAMTELRQDLLRRGFRSDSARIALTGTPDYNEERVLCRHFPELIHEMTLHEGINMGLLAQVRASTFEVDVGASNVRIVAGDYDQKDVELVMTRTPLLQAILEYRYAEELRDMPALICCRTVHQAERVRDFLVEHRPLDALTPRVVHGGVKDDHRRKSLEGFDAGQYDTLITVRALIEGWSSARCKLLIDAAPSLSQVESAQKYTRPMTKDGDRVARIISFVPEALRELPVLPLDVFGPGVEEAMVEESPPPPKSPPSGKKRASPWQRLKACGIRVQSINVRLRLIEDALVSRVNVKRGRDAVHKLVERHFGSTPDATFATYGRFLRTRFQAEGVTFQGRQFLRFLGFRSDPRGYRSFLLKYYPKSVADGMLSMSGFEGKGIRSATHRTRSELRRLGAAVSSEYVATPATYADQEWFRREEIPSGLLQNVEGTEDQSAEWDRQEEIGLLTRALDTLSPMERRILAWRYGLDDEDELTQKAIGEKYNLSHGRIGQLQQQAESKLRDPLRKTRGPSEMEDDCRGPQGWVVQRQAERAYKCPWSFFPPRNLWIEIDREDPPSDVYRFDMRDRKQFYKDYYYQLQIVTTLDTRALKLSCDGERRPLKFDLSNREDITCFWVDDGWLYVNVHHRDMHGIRTFAHPLP